MKILQILTNLFAAIVEVYSMHLIFKMQNKKEKISVVIIAVFSLMYVLFSAIATLYIKSTVVLLSANAVLLLAMSFAYTIKTWVKVFSLMIFVVLGIVFEVVFSLIVCAINGITPSVLGENIVIYVLIACLSKFALFFSVRIIKLFVINKQGLAVPKLNAMFLLIPFSTLIILLIQSKFVFSHATVEDSILIVISSVLIITANISTFIIYDLTMKKEKENSERKQRLIEMQYQEKYYQDMVSAQTLSNKTMHDLKNKMYQINSYIKSGDKKAELLISDMCMQLKGSEIVKYTGLSGVDSMLNAKFFQMQQDVKNIDCKIIMGENNKVESLDLCVMLGNLIDNAYDAVKEVEYDERKIELSITQKDENFNIKLINSTKNDKCLNCLKEPDEKQKLLYPHKVEKMQLIETTKQDKILHGYGLHNVKEIVDRYNGEMNILSRDGVFTVAITIIN